MMARVQLDASHVSRCVTARRESAQVYKSFQRTYEVQTFRLFSLRLRVLSTLRENWSRFLRVLDFYS